MRVILVVLMLCFALAPAAYAQTVSDIRFGKNGTMTRIALDVSGAVPYRAFILANPKRLVLDFPAIAWRAPENKGDATRRITGYRHSIYNRDTLRLVFDLGASVVVADHFRLPPEGKRPWRYVFDLRPVDALTFRQNINTIIAGGTQRDVSKNTVSLTQQRPREKAPVLAAPTRKKPLIVLDAGHGGVDPGAIAKNGMREKNVTLAVAKLVKQRLEATGRYRVKMTRDNDRFIKLPERVRLARAASADVFISLHADTVSRPNVRGASVYTLSETASDAETAKLAERENAVDSLVNVDVGDVDADVADILLDLVTRDTMNQSKVLAETVVSTFKMRGISVLPQRPHRSAGFAVLKAPDIPSVLIEMGFLSNSAEAQTLGTDAHRKKLADAVVAVIDRYFTDTSKRAAY